MNHVHHHPESALGEHTDHDQHASPGHTGHDKHAGHDPEMSAADSG